MKESYSLVLEYADGGTLGEYLRDTTITLKWKNQLKFAKEIASAILWLHDDKGIIHGTLSVYSFYTIKLADFGRSCLKGSKSYNTEVWGVISYIDPKMLDREIPYKLNEKSGIYNLGVIFWELTSRSSPFNYEMRDNYVVMLEILSGKREKPISTSGF
ncbi:kinase-like domain-containing protein [Rhizophagus clarus]|uniref:Kinase-like domain-containing protein n=1 Tax=Rhizophagus clarus TaxID=94130 RepID=A0A8H3LQG1_9GLOM|nr:kinase-like domain-containing protein [Rhizophagus clarus]